MRGKGENTRTEKCGEKREKIYKKKLHKHTRRATERNCGGLERLSQVKREKKNGNRLKSLKRKRRHSDVSRP